jgi:hypothetical protein
MRLKTTPQSLVPLCFLSIRNVFRRHHSGDCLEIVTARRSFSMMAKSCGCSPLCVPFACLVLLALLPAASSFALSLEPALSPLGRGLLSPHSARSGRIPGFVRAGMMTSGVGLRAGVWAEADGGNGGEGEREGRKGGGGVAVITKKPEVEPVKEVEQKKEFKGNWRVLLHRSPLPPPPHKTPSHTVPHLSTKHPHHPNGSISSCQSQQRADNPQIPSI